jgi:hypothetical protein
VNEDELREGLHRLGEEFPVGPARLDALDAAAVRRRRRFGSAILAAGAAGALVVGVVVVRAISQAPHTPASSQTAARAPTTSPASLTASSRPSTLDPATTRLVGVSRAVIAVPRTWATNATDCLTPLRDTVLIDSQGGWCGARQPAGVDSVELRRGLPFSPFHPDTTYRIDGYEVQRTTTTCRPQTDISPAQRSDGYPDVCSGAAYLPALDASFFVTSTTSAQTVEALLSTITISADRVAVPGIAFLQDDPSTTREQAYKNALTSLGLVPNVVADHSNTGLPAGYVTAVDPAPGSVVPLGATVTMTVTR